MMQPPEMYYCWGENSGFEPLNGEKILVSAGVAWNRGDGEFRLNIPDASEILLDSGGFQAATKWHQYPYSPQELFEYAVDIGANRVAGMDVACEDREQLMNMESTKVDPGKVKHRMSRSLTQQKKCDLTYSKSEWPFDFMPVIQGRTVGEYRQFMGWMAECGLDRHPQLALGTICKRSSVNEIYEILKVVRECYPEKDLHLFGATKSIWKDRRFWGMFESSDTKAWTFSPPGTDRMFAESKEEKYECFKAYKKDIETVKTAIEHQTTL